MTSDTPAPSVCVICDAGEFCWAHPNRRQNSISATPSAAPDDTRRTFVIPEGYEAVMDAEGRATGETRPTAAPDVEALRNTLSLFAMAFSNAKANRSLDRLEAATQDKADADGFLATILSAFDALAKRVTDAEERVGLPRMCVNCGKCIPAAMPRTTEVPECVDHATGLSACLFNTTPQEAWEYWRQKEQEQRTRAEKAEAALSRLQTVCDFNERGRLATEAALSECRDKTLEEAVACQPATAENPDESSYQRGKFEGVMEYGRAILALKEKPRG